MKFLVRTQLFPACTARAKQQSGIFTQWTLFNHGGGSAQRGLRSEKTLQVKSRLKRHDVLDSSFGKKHPEQCPHFQKKVHNFCLQHHSKQISLTDHEWETWKRVAREVGAIIIIIITRPKPAYGRQGLAGWWGQDRDEVRTFLVFLMTHFAPAALSSDLNNLGP